KAVDWCRENLSFASFMRNGLAPPLDLDDETFDLAYALSVFTHLTEDLQRAWRDELHRVLRPGGLLLLSTHGRSYLPRLDPGERERFGAGYAFLELEPEGARGNPTQDLVLLKRD